MYTHTHTHTHTTADFFVYLVVCFQIYYFRGNPLNHDRTDSEDDKPDESIWLKYTKVSLRAHMSVCVCVYVRACVCLCVMLWI